MRPEEEDFMSGLEDVLSQDMPIVVPDKVGDKQGKTEDEEKQPLEEEEKKKKAENTNTDDDDEPVFKKDPSKQKKGREDSIADLRKSRDEYKVKTDKYITILGDHDPELLKPIIELVTERADGPITADLISSIISDYKEKEIEITDLRAKLDEEEKRVASIDVQYSKDFENKYKLPYKESVDNLIAEYANVGEDGKILAPELTQELHQFFLNNADKIDGITAKQKLQEFVKKYKAATGEDASIPSINSLMGSLRSYNAKRVAMKDAYENWQSKKKEEETKSAAEQERDRETIQKKNRRERVALASKAFNDFDIDDIDLPESMDMESLFKEEFARGEKIFAGEDVPSYDVMISRGVKANLFDKLLPLLKELQQYKKEQSSNQRSHLKGTDSFEFLGNKGGKTGDDWLGGALKD